MAANEMDAYDKNTTVGLSKVTYLKGDKRPSMKPAKKTVSKISQKDRGRYA
jgi:hypothetical protein